LGHIWFGSSGDRSSGEEMRAAGCILETRKTGCIYVHDVRIGLGNGVWDIWTDQIELSFRTAR
jgi:hypothetical protein